MQGAFLAWRPSGQVFAATCNEKLLFFDVGEAGVVAAGSVEFEDGITQILWLTNDVFKNGSH